MGTPRAWAGAVVKRIGERAGVEISRHRSPVARRARCFAEHGIELLLDVGANRGQYAADLRAHGYEGWIVSFEPLGHPYAELQRRSANDDRWTARQLALSDRDETVEVGAADVFGSALEVGSRLAGLFPESVPATYERVPAARLDDLALDLPPGRRTALKLDVQGYELRVLAGAAGILERVGVVEAELSVAALYEGQPLLPDTIRALTDHGFALESLEPILRDWRSGEYLQFDGIFTAQSSRTNPERYSSSSASAAASA